MRAAVIGAGISGLTAALRLQQAGAEVCVLERENHVGGRMSCLQRDGFAINRAAGIIPGSYEQIRGLIDELGLGDRVELTNPPIGIPIQGTTHRLRSGGAGMLVDAWRTPLLSPRSKLRMARLVRDAFRIRHDLSYADAAAALAHDGESAAAYCRRRLDQDVLDRIVDPICRAMFLVPAEEVSVVDLLFMVTRILGRGQVRYRGGIDLVARAISQRVPVRLGSDVTSVRGDGDEVEVRWLFGAKEHVERFDGCVVALPGTQLADVVDELPDGLKRFLALATWNSSIVGHFALDRRIEERALLLPIPASESDGLVLVANHRLVAPDSAPPGCALVSGYWSHEWSEPRMGLTDADLVPLLQQELARFVPEVDGGTRFCSVDRWRPVVLGMPSGVYEPLAAAAAAVRAAARVQFAGDFLGYGSTNRCSLTGEQAATRLLSVCERGSRPARRRQPAGVAAVRGED